MPKLIQSISVTKLLPECWDYMYSYCDGDVRHSKAKKHTDNSVWEVGEAA